MGSSIISAVQGSWLLVSMTFKNAQGVEIDLYGKNPKGILTYDKSGYMNAQMGYNNRPPFESESLGDGTLEEIATAYKSYMGYYGRYREDSPGVLIHEVEDSLFPNWRGKEEIRYAKIENELLVITTPPTLVGDHEVVIKAVWRRA